MINKFTIFTGREIKVEACEGFLGGTQIDITKGTIKISQDSSVYDLVEAINDFHEYDPVMRLD